MGICINKLFFCCCLFINPTILQIINKFFKNKKVYIKFKSLNLKTKSKKNLII